jgi:quercetin dioxygenase-like cupin family protein
MNLSHATILLTLVATGLAAVSGEQPTAGAGGFSELQRASVADANDLEVVMGIVKRPANSISPKHYHPGGEFGFILEGVVTIEAENEPQETLGAGASFYQKPGKWHIISTHTEGAEAVVFRVLRKGQPMLVAVD